MSTRKFMSAVVLILAATSIASAAHWVGSTGNGLWVDPANWLAGAAPTASDEVSFVTWYGTNEVVNIRAGDNAVAGSNVFVGYNNSGLSSTLNIKGTLTVNGDLRTAFSDDTSIGILNVSDNAVVTCNYLIVGQSGTSTFTMSGNAHVTAGGLWNTMWIAGSVSNMYLNGGVLQLNNSDWSAMYFGDLATGQGGSYYGDPHMDIAGGALKVKNAVAPTVQIYINDGRITANGLTGLSNFLVTSDDTYTTFQAVPEPVTMALLGLGGLFLRARKS